MLPSMMVKLIISYLAFFTFYLFNMTKLLQLGVYGAYRFSSAVFFSLKCSCVGLRLYR